MEVEEGFLAAEATGRGRWYAWAIICLVMFAAVGASGATVRLKTPLQGYYRAGRYLPLHVIASDVRGGSLTISAEHLVPVRIEAPGGTVDTIVPLLPIGTLPEQLELSDETRLDPVSMSWRALGDDERLIGLVGVAPRDAPQLFAGQRVRFVALDPDQAELFEHAPQSDAWETLDALVVDTSAAARMDESMLSILLANGAVFAQRSEAPPPAGWPWVRDGTFWVLRFDPLGPRGSSDAAVYQPTYGWVRGWPNEVREIAVAGAILFIVIAALISLARLSGVGVVFLIACLSFCAAWVAWDRSRPRTIQLDGEIQIDDGSLTQRDSLTWEASLVDTRSSWIAHRCAHPLLASRMQGQSLDLAMRWDPNIRRLQFEYSLSRGRSIALLTRSVASQNVPIRPTVLETNDPDSAFLLDLFNKRYADANTRVISTRTRKDTRSAELLARRAAP